MNNQKKLIEELNHYHSSPKVKGSDGSFTTAPTSELTPKPTPADTAEEARIRGLQAIAEYRKHLYLSARSNMSLY